LDPDPEENVGRSVEYRNPNTARSSLLRSRNVKARVERRLSGHPGGTVKRRGSGGLALLEAVEQCDGLGLRLGVQLVPEQLDQPLVVAQRPTALTAPGQAQHQAAVRLLVQVLLQHDALVGVHGFRVPVGPDQQLAQRFEAVDPEATQPVPRLPPELEVHLIVDNYGTHKTELIKRWLAKRPRFHIHFTPTGASWLNLIERWFAALTEKQIRRGAHRSTRELEHAILNYIEHGNQDPKPFMWTKTADQILENIARFCERTSASGH
jgi:transposase